MTTNLKPRIPLSELSQFLGELFSSEAADIAPLNGGNLSNVYAFRIGDRRYVIKLSDLDSAYDTDRFVSELLTSQGVPYPRLIGHGSFGALHYIIIEHIEGRNLADCTTEQKKAQMPQLMRILAHMNQIDVSRTSGFGNIEPNGDGAYATWTDYLVARFAEEQPVGNFWHGWHDLFRTTCLEKDVFDELYSRLMTYAVYNAPHRHFVHSDFHQWNILSDGERITGIIDGNFEYGDFLIDLATLKSHMWDIDIEACYESYLEQEGITIPNFRERLIGAYYYKGLDGLRFYAKMGWEEAYRSERDKLFMLPT